ncbi:hypothetical protein [Rhizobium sp. NRK18]|uniref:hypothetical protein n=1 Tax=Rhizobium sp. NRK18 TaxID=2964667 RepID=UPI0021C3D705|nr:hypothetical protein [Rhizobium sp. NRK18]MCQ2005854.1 hypothetical protein [Rhizobium sp. NRK18]
MKIDFSDLLSDEITQVPKEIQPFVKEKDWPSADPFAQTWMNYSSIYSHAVDVMAQRVISGHWYDKNLIIPLLYVVRHSIELSLKYAISHVAAYTSLPTNTQGHNLLVLFDHLQKQYMQATGLPTDDEWTAFCRKLIIHIAEFDPGGDRFRYPSNNRGDTFTEADVDMEGLLKAHAHLTGWATATVAVLEG